MGAFPFSGEFRLTDQHAMLPTADIGISGALELRHSTSREEAIQRRYKAMGL